MSVVPLPLAPRHWARFQALLGGVFLLTFVFFAFWARFGSPYRDDWDWVLFQLAGPGGLAGLLAPHNEHVIPLARLLSAWQLRWGGLNGSLIQNAALLCHLVSIGLFWMEIRRHWPDRAGMRRVVTGVTLVVLGSMYQLQSMVFGAAILFPLVQVWMLLAVVAALNATDPRRAGHGWWWAATSAACVGAAASMTTGAVVPVIVAVIALGRGARVRMALAFAILTGAATAGYLMLTSQGGEEAGVVAESSPRVLEAAVYVVAVFGAGATSLGSAVGAALGAGVLVLIVAAGVVAVRRPAAMSRLQWFALALMAFAVVSAVAASLGRAQFGVLQAGQSRYATFVMGAIAGLALFASVRMDQAGLPASLRSLVGAMSVCVSLALLVPQLYVGLLWKAKADNLAAAFLSLRSGAADVPWLLTSHPLPDVVLRTVEAIEARGGQVVDPAILTSANVPPALAACGGQWTLERHGRLGEMRLKGEAGTVAAFARIVDGTGTIVGLSTPAPWVATPDPSQAEVNAAVRVSIMGRGERANQWIGFAQRGAGPPYRWLGQDRSGRWVCAEPLTVTPITHMALDAVRAETADTMIAIGWGFACGSDAASWDLRIDNASVPLRVTAGLPRPDVEAALRLQCAPAAAPGVNLRFDAAPLSPGRHVAMLQMVTVSGHRAQSGPVEFHR